MIHLPQTSNKLSEESMRLSYPNIIGTTMMALVDSCHETTEMKKLSFSPRRDAQRVQKKREEKKKHANKTSA
jgi:hypothetical protein